MSKKTILLLVSALLIIAVGTGSTVAFLSTKSQTIENQFSPAHVSTTVDEPGWSDGNEIKENVAIQNTGDVASYIRAAIVVNWTDEYTSVVFDAIPVSGTDYAMDLNTADWTHGADGYYYYNSIVAPGEKTANLINSCQVLLPYVDTMGKGRQGRLTVTVLSDGIQAAGMGDDVTDAQSAFTKAASGT